MSTLTHCFIVPAYGRSPYLGDCLTSLGRQSKPSRIVVFTSTPFEGMEEYVAQFGAELVCHGPNKGMANDWNYALRGVDADWVTIAHQDDVYGRDFLARTLDGIDKYPDAKLVFTDYCERDERGIRPVSLPLRVKQTIIRFATRGRGVAASAGAQANLLRFGCAIPCPSVTLRRELAVALGGFGTEFRVNMDWDFWLRIAGEPGGAFVHCRGVLMEHRIHKGSETTAGIADGIRSAEDRSLFRRVWPTPIADFLAFLYRLTYRYN